MSKPRTLTAVDLEFDFADRLRRAMRVSGVGAGELADRLEVHRNAVSGWINGKHMPRPRDIRAAAEITGVPVEWLITGKAPVANDEGQESQLWDLNPRPVLYKGNIPERACAIPDTAAELFEIWNVGAAA